MTCKFGHDLKIGKDKNKDNAILLEKMGVLSLSKRGDADG